MSEMKKEYSYKENIMWFEEKQIVFSERITEIIEFEKYLVIKNKYSNKNPTNNLAVFDFDDITKPLTSQTVVSIGKKDSRHISIITFTGLNLLVEVESGRIVDEKITK